MEIMKVAIYLEKNRQFSINMGRSLINFSKFIEVSILDNIEAADNENYDLIVTDLKTDSANTVTAVYCPYDKSTDTSIFIYEPVTQVYNSLVDYCFTITGKLICAKGSGNCKIVAVTSQKGGAGSTSVSIGLCKSISKLTGHKAVYISLTDINDGIAYKKSKRKLSSKKLNYYVDKKEDFPINPFLIEEDISYMQTEFINYEYEFIDLKFLEKFIRLLDKQENYSAAVLDIGTGLSMKNIEILRCSDIIVEVVKGEILEESINDNVLSSIYKGIDETKILRVENMVSEDYIGDKKLYITKDYDAFKKREEQMIIDSDSFFSGAIYEITETILEKVYG